MSSFSDLLSLARLQANKIQIQEQHDNHNNSSSSNKYVDDEVKESKQDLNNNNNITDLYSVDYDDNNIDIIDLLTDSEDETDDTNSDTSSDSDNSINNNNNNNVQQQYNNNDITIDWYWLCDHINEYIVKTQNSELDIHYLATTTLQLLHDKQYNDIILSNELYSLYGDNGLDLISTLIAHRQQLQSVKALKTTERPIQYINNNDSNKHNNQHLRNLVGVSIKHESLIKQQKEQRKLARQLQKQRQQQHNKDHNDKTIKQPRQRNIINEHKLNEQAHILDDWKSDNIDEFYNNALPLNAIRVQNKQYEEVTIPAVEPKTIDNTKLIPTTVFPDWYVITT